MEEKKDILLKPKADRRILSNVPDPRRVRTSSDRRGVSTTDKKGNILRFAKVPDGVRYLSEIDVKLKGYSKDGKRILNLAPVFKSVDISGTGILLACENDEQAKLLEKTDYVKLKFTVTPGSMPEGFETKVKMRSKFANARKNEEKNRTECGFQFEKTLAEYIHKARGRYLYTMSTVMLAFVALFIMLMRAESILYFAFNRNLYIYSIIAAVFLLSRYFFGMLYRPVPIDPDYTPAVSIVIPCFNEETWIERTIESCMNQDYPPEKLEVIVVDDYSTDNSVDKIKNAIEKIRFSDEMLGMTEPRISYVEMNATDTRERLKYYAMDENGGKREALSLGIQHTKHDLVVFVDSDSFLDPLAIRNLVQPFRDPKMGGVAGRTDVANVYTNWLTKMQTARYFIAFRVMKAAESYFDAVTCPSGPLACYKKSVVMANLEKWRKQEFLGQPATFGDDRALTNLILRTHRTAYQDTALCSTIVPNVQKSFLKQQIRWKRSWLRESVIAGSFIWKKEPLAALFFYMSFIIPFVAPIIVLFNFVYVPITNQIFPTTFLIGFFMMAMLMSFAYLLFKRSRIWLYGMFFCIYYITVLLWQMPYAWVTFWKTTWGTRMTPADVEEEERKAGKKKAEAV